MLAIILFPAKLDIHNRSNGFLVAAFYLDNRRIQIRKSIPKQTGRASPLATDPLVVQHRGFCSQNPSMLSPLPKKTGDHCHSCGNCWIRTPAHSDDGDSVHHHWAACPVAEVPRSSPPPEGSLEEPPENRDAPIAHPAPPSIPLPSSSAQHMPPSLSPGQEALMEPTTTTKRYTTADGIAHKARASLCMSYMPQGKTCQRRAYFASYSKQHWQLHQMISLCPEEKKNEVTI